MQNPHPNLYSRYPGLHSAASLFLLVIRLVIWLIARFWVHNFSKYTYLHLNISVHIFLMTAALNPFHYFGIYQIGPRHHASSNSQVVVLTDYKDREFIILYD